MAAGTVNSLSLISPTTPKGQNQTHLLHLLLLKSIELPIPKSSLIPMDLRTRKLLFTPEDDEFRSGISSSISSAVMKHHRQSLKSFHHNLTKSNEDCSNGETNSYRLNPPFDSSMTVTIILLLTALFFMGFISIYIRRFSGNSTIDQYRTPRRSLATRPAKGVDLETVKSLPVFGYDGFAKQGIVAELECAICLSEFEEDECVKVIPFCGHVFHVGCIDKWLACHVTCPLCRTAKLFAEKKEEVMVAIGCDVGGDEPPVIGLESTVDDRDTWHEESRCVGSSEFRRSNSFSTLGERQVLSRSLSF